MVSHIVTVSKFVLLPRERVRVKNAGYNLFVAANTNMEPRSAKVANILWWYFVLIANGHKFLKPLSNNIWVLCILLVDFLNPLLVK